MSDGVSTCADPVLKIDVIKMKDPAGGEHVYSEDILPPTELLVNDKN